MYRETKMYYVVEDEDGEIYMTDYVCQSDVLLDQADNMKDAEFKLLRQLELMGK